MTPITSKTQATGALQALIGALGAMAIQQGWLDSELVASISSVVLAAGGLFAIYLRRKPGEQGRPK